MDKRFYITTAIDYVNGAPHLGHAYEKVVADVIARARRSMGQSVFFLTGSDEHGQKVQQAAHDLGQTPQAYCDGLAIQWSAFVSIKDGVTLQTSQLSSSFVPAPGALALLGVAGFASRRRRA